MLNWLANIVDRVCAVVGALIFAQFPSYVMQYQHQLAGHVNELRHQVGLLKENASHSGKSLDQLIQKFLKVQDADVVSQGEFIQSMVERLNEMTRSLVALHDSTVWTKPFVFLYHLDRQIAADTASDYTWTIPFTFEGLIYALIGVIAGFAFYNVSARFCRYIYHAVTNGHRKHLENQTKKTQHP
ncbi:MAG: DUF2937 family protein [Chlamydiales bacterium]|nr:DUF2937 family protein [Chlamydiales bacterium]